MYKKLLLTTLACTSIAHRVNGESFDQDSLRKLIAEEIRKNNTELRKVVNRRLPIVVHAAICGAAVAIIYNNRNAITQQTCHKLGELADKLSEQLRIASENAAKALSQEIEAENSQAKASATNENLPTDENSSKQAK